MKGQGVKDKSPNSAVKINKQNEIFAEQEATESEEETIDQKTADENRIVSAWLLFYYERKSDYEQRRLDLTHGSSSGPAQIPPGKGSAVSDVTGRKAAKLADLDREQGEWLKLVEFIEERLPEKQRVFLYWRREFRHRRGNQGWVVPLQHKYAEDMARRTGKRKEDFWISDRNTLFRWWNRIVEFAAREAAKRGLLT